MDFNILFCNILSFHKFSLIFQTTKNNLIPTQMNIPIRKQLKHLFKNIFNQFISFIHSYIKCTFIFTIFESTGNICMFWCLSPTCSMTRCIYLWYNSHTTNHCVSDKIPYLLNSISFIDTKTPILCQLRMIFKLKWK